jgi:hypothetical protein
MAQKTGPQEEAENTGDFSGNEPNGPIGPILGRREKNWLAVSYSRPREPFEAGCVSFRTRLHPRVRRVRCVHPRSFPVGRVGRANAQLFFRKRNREYLATKLSIV